MTQDGDYLVLALVGPPGARQIIHRSQIKIILGLERFRMPGLQRRQRRRAASDDSLEKNLCPPTATPLFLDNANKDAAARRSPAMDTLDSLFDYLESGEGEVGIFDAKLDKAATVFG